MVFTLGVQVTDRTEPAEEQSEAHEFSLKVLESTRVSQLRPLVLMQLRAGQRSREFRRAATAPAMSAPEERSPPTSPQAVAASTPTGAQCKRRTSFDPPPRAAPTALALQVVFGGRVLSSEDDGRTLADIGIADGVTIHCVVSAKVDEGQRVSCFPHSSNTDGGRTVHVLGEKFPSSSRIACRFGRVTVGAKVEDDGEASGVPMLSCVCPPHLAGPVTLSVSFDGGVTWLEGPTFWYWDPSFQGCARAITVPADCQSGRSAVSALSASLPWVARYDRGPDEPDAGAGCA